MNIQEKKGKTWVESAISLTTMTRTRSSTAQRKLKATMAAPKSQRTTTLTADMTSDWTVRYPPSKTGTVTIKFLRSKYRKTEITLSNSGKMRTNSLRLIEIIIYLTRVCLMSLSIRRASKMSWNRRKMTQIYPNIWLRKEIEQFSNSHFFNFLYYLYGAN